MKNKKLTFLQIGLGSMGKRRIRNLFSNNEKNIIGFDFSKERRKEAEEKYGVRVVSDLSELSDGDYDAMIISTPPNLHGDYIRQALKKKKHFFVEVTTSDDGYKEILASRDLNTIKAPSCTFRFFLPIKKIKQLIDSGRIGKVLAFQHHMGQYLPDWHPWEDYRNVYFSKKETGACREMFPFELTWLNWLVGNLVSEISGYSAKVSDLEMEAHDLIVSNIKYENNIFGNVMIDLVSRKPFRTLRILGTNGVLDWEWLENIIKIYDVSSKKTELIEVPSGNPATGYLAVEEMYNDEIKAFLYAVYRKADYPYSFKEDQMNLNTLYKLEKNFRK